MDDVTFEPATHPPDEGAVRLLGAPGDLRAGTSSSPVPEGLPPMKPGSIGVRYRLKSRFRSCDAFACVPTYLAQTRGCDTVIGSRGERLHGGHAHTRLLVDGAPVEASDENLDALIRRTVPADIVRAAHPAEAERALLAAMRPALDRYLLIDDEVWVRVPDERIA